jgi:GTP-binding protein EngB required for normal cell division
MIARRAGLALIVIGAVLLPAEQLPRRRDSPDEVDESHYPRGRKQVEEMLKADHLKNVTDAADLARMANELKEELDNTDAHVLSASALKKAEEIEKLARRIKGRLRH